MRRLEMGRILSKPAFQADADFLRNRVACGELNRVGTLQRNAVGFERRVGPVSLVLHFENFALELNSGPNPVGDFVNDCTQIFRGLMRRDELRKRAFGGLAICGFQNPRLTSSCWSVEHAESDPVALEGRVRLPIEGEFDLAFFRPVIDPFQRKSTPNPS